MRIKIHNYINLNSKKFSVKFFNQRLPFVYILFNFFYRTFIVNLKSKDSYTIAPYTPKDDFQEMMKDMPLSVVMGAVVFFYDLGMELSMATLNYMEKLAKDKNNIQLKRLLEQNGDGLAQYTALAKGISSDLIRLQLNPFSNV